jgi:hypothetical protein
MPQSKIFWNWKSRIFWGWKGEKGRAKEKERKRVQWNGVEWRGEEKGEECRRELGFNIGEEKGRLPQSISIIFWVRRENVAV